MVKIKIICEEADLIFLNERYYELVDNELILNVPEDSISEYEFIGENNGFQVERIVDKPKKPVSKKAKK